jgi:hypothetical protein
MLTRILMLIGLGLSGTVVFTGAWSGSFAPAPQAADVGFTPQNVPLDADVVGSGVTAADLLAKAIEKLAPERTAWLKAKIRQTMNDNGAVFHAEGVLQRGPNHCARLELETMRDGVRGRLVVVSDGELLVQVRRAGSAAPIARLERLPPLSPDAPAEGAAAREKHLDAKGGGGPRGLLQQFRQRSKNGKLQTGLLDGAPVIQIKADLDPAPPKTPARLGYAYLDAKTLWPRRIEWWSPDKTDAARPLVQIEFLEPEINHALSLEECTLAFSYQPGGNEKLTEK